MIFNGSSRTLDGASLNASLHVGPNLLPALSDILTVGVAIVSSSSQTWRRCTAKSRCTLLTVTSKGSRGGKKQG